MSPDLSGRATGSESELSARWRSQSRIAASHGHDPDCSGHGWMLRSGLTEVLDPIVHLRRQTEDDLYSFTALGADHAAALLALLDDDYLARERQNDGPTLGTVLRAVVAHPQQLRAHGYLIAPQRCDERITVEGVLLRADATYRLCSPCRRRRSNCECTVLYRRLVDQFGVDDARTPPDELDCRRVFEPSAAGYRESLWYRAWWD